MCIGLALGAWDGFLHPRGDHGKFAPSHNAQSSDGGGGAKKKHQKKVDAAMALLAELGIDIPADIVFDAPVTGTNYGGPNATVDSSGRIHVTPGTQAFDDPKALAAVLAHEAFHIKHGPAERPAYDEQLRVLRLLKAKSSVIKDVEHAKSVVTGGSR